MRVLETMIDARQLNLSPAMMTLAPCLSPSDFQLNTEPTLQLLPLSPISTRQTGSKMGVNHMHVLRLYNVKPGMPPFRKKRWNPRARAYNRTKTCRFLSIVLGWLSVKRLPHCIQASTCFHGPSPSQTLYPPLTSLHRYH